MDHNNQSGIRIRKSSIKNPLRTPKYEAEFADFVDRLLSEKYVAYPGGWTVLFEGETLGPASLVYHTANSDVVAVHIRCPHVCLTSGKLPRCVFVMSSFPSVSTPWQQVTSTGSLWSRCANTSDTQSTKAKRRASLPGVRSTTARGLLSASYPMSFGKSLDAMMIPLALSVWNARVFSYFEHAPPPRRHAETATGSHSQHYRTTKKAK